MKNSNLYLGKKVRIITSENTTLIGTCSLIEKDEKSGQYLFAVVTKTGFLGIYENEISKIEIIK